MVHKLPLRSATSSPVDLMRLRSRSPEVRRGNSGRRLSIEMGVRRFQRSESINRTPSDKAVKVLCRCIESNRTLVRNLGLGAIAPNGSGTEATELRGVDVPSKGTGLSSAGAWAGVGAWGAADVAGRRQGAVTERQPGRGGLAARLTACEPPAAQRRAADHPLPATRPADRGGQPCRGAGPRCGP